MGETAFPDKDEGSVTLSVYSRATMDIGVIENPDSYFLHKVFSDYGNTYPQHRTEILGSTSDWTSSKFLYNAGGLGYIMASLG